MQLEVVIYISISYLATHRRVSRNNAQAKISIKKGTGESTGDKIQAKVSCISLSLARDKELAFCWKLLCITLI